ncbi:MAG: cytochrome c family protein [Chloroflexi bacterium OLB14]|nr:MAG: cytochrome c family protein [Chloroflexi bacterium OLB14]
MRKVWFVSFILGLLVSACGTSSTPTEVSIATVPPEYAGMANPLGDDAIENGKATFQSTCKSCHGEEGRGDGPASQALNPPPKNLVELQNKLVMIICFGRFRKAMLVRQW